MAQGSSNSRREQGVYFSDCFGALMTAGMEETVFYQRQAPATVHSKRSKLFQQVTMHSDDIPGLAFLV